MATRTGFLPRARSAGRAATALGMMVTLAACPSGGGGTGSDNTAARVTVSAPATTLEAGATLQLSALASNREGDGLTGRTFTWSSSNNSVATVNASGQVSGVSPGTATISASTPGAGNAAVVGSVGVTVTPAAVATVVVSPAGSSVVAGQTQQLAAELRDARGNLLTGRTVTWSSGNNDVATVSGTGLVTAVSAGGPVVITATSEGRSGTAQVTVQPRTATRVQVAPQLAVLNVGSGADFTAQAFDAAGAIPNPPVVWSTSAASVATVAAAGRVTGVAPGSAAIRGQVSAVSDTGWVVVLGPTSLYSSALAGASPRTEVHAGQTVTVAVMLDLSRVSANGDLGAVQFDLLYDPAILVFQSSTAGVTGSTNTNVPTPGTFKFSFASTTPQGSGNLTLATLTFQVAAAAPAGAQRAFTLNYTAGPTSTGFAALGTPVVLNGGVRVTP